MQKAQVRYGVKWRCNGRECLDCEGITVPVVRLRRSDKEGSLWFVHLRSLRSMAVYREVTEGVTPPSSGQMSHS